MYLATIEIRHVDPEQFFTKATPTPVLYFLQRKEIYAALIDAFEEYR